ncbi:MAG: M15 family metallopeptidase [Nitratireductor sp.]
MKPVPALAVLLIGLIVPMSGVARGETMPKGFVHVKDIAPTIIEDIRYATSNNFTGAVVPGYEAARCILARPVAEALARVQAEFEKSGKSLLVFDCYRPRRAVESFVRWARRQGSGTDPVYHPDIAGSQLVALGYIAARSGHSSGGSLDLTFAVRDGHGDFVAADMGGGFDLFDPSSHTASNKVSQTARANRQLLVSTMVKYGFANYHREWWHFRFGDEPFAGRAFDFPVSAKLRQE